MSKNKVSINILRRVVLDGLLLIGLHGCIISSSMLWEPFHRGFFCNDESLMYPYKTDTVTVLVLRLVGSGLPTLIFLICEIAALRKVRDHEVCLGIRIPAWARGFYCVLSSFLFGACFTEIATNIAKDVIGRPRPHFFDVCVPSINCTSPQYMNRYIQFHEFECTGPRTDRYEEARKSFPSGHSSWAAYSMIYAAMYLQSRMTWRGSRGLRHTLQFGIVMLSWFTALSRISDYKHHWSDVLAGYALGLVFAIIAFTFGRDVVRPKSDRPAMSQFETTVVNTHTELQHQN